MNLNLSASVGFIALFGVAMLNGVVLVSSINQLRNDGESIRHAVLSGAQTAFATGPDDSLRRQLWVYSNGARHLHRRRGATAAGIGRDRRLVQLHVADVVPASCAL